MTPFDAAPLVRELLVEAAKLRPVDRAQDTSDFLAQHSRVVSGLARLADALEAAGRDALAEHRALVDRVFGPKPAPKRKLVQVGDVHYDARGRASVLLRPL